MEIEKIVATDRASRFSAGSTMANIDETCCQVSTQGCRRCTITYSSILITIWFQHCYPITMVRHALASGRRCCCCYVQHKINNLTLPLLFSQHGRQMYIYIYIYRHAYGEPLTSHRLVNQEDLLPDQIEPPLLRRRRRGGPRKRQIESQIVT